MSVERELAATNRPNSGLCQRNRKLARQKWGLEAKHPLLVALVSLTQEHMISVSAGDVTLLQGNWYITHTGLLRIAKRSRCVGMHVKAIAELADPTTHRFAFEATVFKSKSCKGFVGYGDADPSNVSWQVQGAELRIAETRAINRALRKAYGIGICSIEELGSLTEPAPLSQELRRYPPQPANGDGNINTNGSGNCGAPKVRDRLCQLIRQHRLDASLVKSYAMDFCGVGELRDATREQVENFVVHLGDWAERDRNALLCQLNSYPTNEAISKEGAA